MPPNLSKFNDYIYQVRNPEIFINIPNKIFNPDLKFEEISQWLDSFTEQILKQSNKNNIEINNRE